MASTVPPQVSEACSGGSIPLWSKSQGRKSLLGLASMATTAANLTSTITAMNHSFLLSKVK